MLDNSICSNFVAIVVGLTVIVTFDKADERARGPN